MVHPRLVSTHVHSAYLNLHGRHSMKTILDWAIRHLVRQYEALDREPDAQLERAEATTTLRLQSASTQVRG